MSCGSFRAHLLEHNLAVLYVSKLFPDDELEVPFVVQQFLGPFELLYAVL